MLVVSPLVKGRRGLIIFETLQNGTIDHDLMVLEFSSHNSEGIVYKMVIDMNFGQPVRGT